MNPSLKLSRFSQFLNLATLHQVAGEAVIFIKEELRFSKEQKNLCLHIDLQKFKMDQALANKENQKA